MSTDSIRTRLWLATPALAYPRTLTKAPSQNDSTYRAGPNRRDSQRYDVKETPFDGFSIGGDVKVARSALIGQNLT